MRRRFGYAIAGVLVAVLLAVAAGWRVRVADRAGSMTAAQAPGLSIVIDRSARRLYMIKNGAVVRSFPVAVGSSRHPTPAGTFYIRHITWNPRWVPPDSKWARREKPKGPGELDNPMGNVKMFFRDPDYYIHGTRDYDSLGAPESHGCVRMANGEAVGLAEEVMRAGGANVSDSWFDRILDHVRSSRQVHLKHPIRVTIR